MGQIPPFMQGEGQQAPEPAKKNNTVLWVVLAVVLGGGCFVCVILAAILLPVFSQAKKAATATSSLSNVKQISTGLILYTSDFDDRMPKADQWQDLLETYTKNADLFIPPYEKDPGGYALNSHLSGALLYDIPVPAKTPMVFETSESGKNLSGGIEILRKAEERVCIGMADSSSRRLPYSSATSYDWTPKLSK